MKEIYGNLWDHYDNGIPICINTNGYVRKSGHAVMGRGVALQATKKFPQISKLLGDMLGGPTRIMQHNHQYVKEILPLIINFPVKPTWGFLADVMPGLRGRFVQGKVPGWAVYADLNIIESSLVLLSWLKDERGFSRIVLPRPGCGAGGLDWEKDVKPLCDWYGDWLEVITWLRK